MRTTSLVNKIIQVARVAIEEQEKATAAVESWGLLSARGHEVIASVVLTTDEGNQMFTVWVVANLDTEEVYTIFEGGVK